MGKMAVCVISDKRCQDYFDLNDYSLMQHAGLQYGQGGILPHHHHPSHHHHHHQHQPIIQSPPYDVATTSTTNTTTSLRQFRKKDAIDKNVTDGMINETHIARVPPHNHYPARPNDYFRYQYTDYNNPKYGIDLLGENQNGKHNKDIEMCNMLKTNTYQSDTQYGTTKELQYPQYNKYGSTLGGTSNTNQCRSNKFIPAPPPPVDNDFLAKLQRIHPTMARSIMNDHQQRLYHLTPEQRYYQNSYNYPTVTPYNYTCNYQRTNQPRYTPPPPPQAAPSRRQYDQLTMGFNLSKPTFPQYNLTNATDYPGPPPPSSLPPPQPTHHHHHHPPNQSQPNIYHSTRTGRDFFQTTNTNDTNRASSELRHYLETWDDDEDGSNLYDNEHTTEITNNNKIETDGTNVDFIGVVANENVNQYLIKNKNESTTNDVNLQLIDSDAVVTSEKSDCMLVGNVDTVNADNTSTQTANYYQPTPTVVDSNDVNDNALMNALDEIVNAENEDGIKDMPLIDDLPEVITEISTNPDSKRNQRIFSVDDIIGSKDKEKIDETTLTATTETPSSVDDEIQYRNAICVEDNSVILEIAGILVQLNVHTTNGNKILSVQPLTDDQNNLVIDVNENYEWAENCEKNGDTKDENLTNHVPEPDSLDNEIIIGDDIHEEITIEMNGELRTKAAKKSYDDQVPDEIEPFNKTDKSKVPNNEPRINTPEIEDEKIESNGTEIINNEPIIEKSTPLEPTIEEKIEPQPSKIVEEKTESINKPKVPNDEPIGEETSKNEPPPPIEPKTHIVESIPEKNEESKPQTEQKSKIEPIQEKISKLEPQIEEKEKIEPSPSKKLKTPSDEPKHKKATKSERKQKIEPTSSPKKSKNHKKIKSKPSEIKRKISPIKCYHNKPKKSNLEPIKESPPPKSEPIIANYPMPENIEELVSEKIERAINETPSNQYEPQPDTRCHCTKNFDQINKPQSYDGYRKKLSLEEYKGRKKCTKSPILWEEDTLQRYKAEVDSKLDSLHINVPKQKPPSPTTTQKICVLMNRLLSTNHLAELKSDLDKPDMLLMSKKRRRKKSRFRNLYTSEEDDEDEDEVEDDTMESGDDFSKMSAYSVVQHNSNSAGVPKLIFKRKSLPQPFVKLERSKTAELMAKKRKSH